MKNFSAVWGYTKRIDRDEQLSSFIDENQSQIGFEMILEAAPYELVNGEAIVTIIEVAIVVIEDDVETSTTC